MMATRRTFIRRSAMAAAGAGITGLAPLVAGPSGRKRASGETIRAGLTGCKNMGFYNLSDLLLVPGVVCTALCDVDKSILDNRLKDVMDVQDKKPAIFSDYRKMLEMKDLDVVIIGTPDHWHCLQLVHACEAGKDVYVEKPLANSIEECNVMVRAAKRYNRVVTVGQQQRSGKHWKEAMAFIWTGALGKIRKVKVWGNFHYGAGRPAEPDEAVPAGVDFDMWLGPAPKRSFNPGRFHGSWRMFWDYGGGLMTDWGVHLLDMGLWALNIRSAPKSVMAWGGTFHSEGNAIETADTQTVIYEYDGFSITWEHEGGIQTGPYGKNYGISFIGENGTLVADRSSWEVFREWRNDKWAMEEVPVRHSDEKSHINHVENFIQCVKTREKPACSIETGRNAAIVSHLGNIAYRTGHKLVYQESTGKFLQDPVADAYLKPDYRAPWKFPAV